MIVVMADDLSGAAELAGVARRHGLTAEVQTAFSPTSDAAVICVDTDSRSLAPNLAATRVEAVAGEVVAARPEWIFKKCDSVLRGAVLAESLAIAAAAGKTRLMILPANPSRGRVVRDGSYFVHGQPLNETAFARDPEHPRTSSRVTELLGRAVDATRILIPDATSGHDLERCANQLEEDTLAVGAADFFEAILRRRVPARSPGQAGVTQTEAESPKSARGTLLVCGSAASWILRRDEAEALGIPVFALPHDLAKILASLRTRHRVVVGIGNGAVTRGASPLALAHALAVTVGAVLRETPVARLLSEGGATSAAVLRAMGWTRLRVSEISPHGVGVLQPVGATSPTLLIKPGSYAWPPEIWPGSARGTD